MRRTTRCRSGIRPRIPRCSAGHPFAGILAFQGPSHPPRLTDPRPSLTCFRLELPRIGLRDDATGARVTTFRELGLKAEFVDALAAQGIDEPFPIQAATIADALAGRDVCGKAQTGSGKTLAFGLPMLQTVSPA